jgi:hypothetical protein
MSPRSTTRYAKNDFHAGAIFGANNLQMDQNELSLDPRRLGVKSSASKMIYEPMGSKQTVHLSYVEINGISIPTEMRFHLAYVM